MVFLIGVQFQWAWRPVKEKVYNFTDICKNFRRGYFASDEKNIEDKNE
jgi:hypothetical protein